MKRLTKIFARLARAHQLLLESSVKIQDVECETSYDADPVAMVLAYWPVLTATSRMHEAAAREDYDLARFWRDESNYLAVWQIMSGQKV